MTRIFINGRFLSQRVTGVQRYAREVVLQLSELVRTEDPCVQGLEFEIIAPKNAVLDL
jgi:hypothetical protein